MKYGLMYYKNTDNIGDDIQTYVAMKYLPHVDYYIDRENLSCFIPKEKEYVAMIMNGWFIHNKLAWPPSPYIKPLLISMHFKSLEDTDVGDIYLKSFGGDFLRKYGPVGSRDLETKNRLENNEIETYFSGCMTLTLNRFSGIKKEDKIYLVDVGQDIINKVKENTFSKIELLTHTLNQQETASKDINQRMNNVENLLKKYQSAKLVITTRLHAALPCIALKTPVVLIHKDFFDEDRLGTFFEYVTNYTDEEFLKMDIKEMLDSPKANKDSYIRIKKKIDKTCKDFIKKCNKNLNSNELPEINEYINYANKLTWYKEIYERERLIVEKIEHKRIEEYNLYHKNIEKVMKDGENTNG